MLKKDSIIEVFNKLNDNPDIILKTTILPSIIKGNAFYKDNVISININAVNNMKEVYEKLIKHLTSMTSEEKEKDWEKLKKYNKIGPSVEEMLKVNKMEIKTSSYIQQQWEYKTRTIIICQYGSVLVDITSSPNGKDRKAFIFSLNVEEEHRNKGIGTALLKQAEKYIKNQSIQTVELEWISPTPLWVYNMYIKNGYQEKDFDDGYSRLYKDLK